MFRHTTLSDHIQVLEETCKYLVGTGKKQLIGELLTQNFIFLKSSQPFLRASAVTVIGLITKRLNMSNLHKDDVATLRNALLSVRNDPSEPIQSLANIVLKRMSVNTKSKPGLTSTLSRLSTNLLKVSCIKDRTKKKRLFKVSKQEEDNDSNQKKKGWSWVEDNLSLLSTWHQRRVKNTPPEGSLYETPKIERTQEEVLSFQKPAFLDSEIFRSGSRAFPAV
ncbi:uncharacterized protein LOC135231256 [Loxodonta africana]|uniref:uncharacterized protein LOC135231256 n=1 Tax=Loxodonta africana TaxID=9785 RepID=UPI0030CF1D27